MARQQITIPARFAADHFDRCGLEQEEGGAATIIRKGSRTWTVQLNDAALANLRSDAAYYADENGPDLLPPGLKASAKRTAATLHNLGAGA